MESVPGKGRWAVKALLSTENEDGTYEVAVLRVRWEQGPVIHATMPARGRTARNLAVRPDVVISLPAAEAAGEDSAYGARHRCAEAPWTEPSELVRPPRVVDCPVQLEARGGGARTTPDGAWTEIEAQVLRVHADPRWVLPLGDRRLGVSTWCPPVHDFRSSSAPVPLAVPATARELARKLGRRFPVQQSGAGGGLSPLENA
ncbi:hypothetical protein [Streptomyces sp. MST-110588]|uniref:hypothetical protein n=1 Tax=Streptomyces sp. MST-110588 TaxID=2833628 RepID=UPI001F5CAAE0|nr:hypothetical protein [Streptomyces sp. MST-110588]UNO42639.1 hypothetical protein KGS77_27765 [Streptomyces sp. MST-110588]